MNLTVTEKEMGVVYTPLQLGKYMAKKMFNFCECIDSNKVYKILDPSCGTGELLFATYLIAEELGINIEIYGFDLDKEALEVASNKFKDLNINTHFYHEDFLTYALEHEFNQQSLFYNDKFPTFDFCIANPPYIRTQLLGEDYSQNLAKNFNLKGKVDIYQAFYMAINKVLTSTGHIAVITSNKFITNNTGKTLRKELLKNYSIHELVDLGDTKLFNAAVLPAIIFAQNNTSPKKDETIPFYSIYETREIDNINKSKKANIYDIIDTDTTGIYQVNETCFISQKGVIILPDDESEPWSLSSIEDYIWTKKIDEMFPYRISDFGKVRVGIKTTADKVFLNQGFDGFNPEEELVHPIFSSDNSSRWMLKEPVQNLKKILYPMKIGTGKRKAEPVDLSIYKNTSDYLNSYFEQLNQRKYIHKSGRKWFEIWVPQDPSLWSKNKIIWPDISDEPKFIFDSDGLYVDGNCYWLTLDNDVDDEVIYLILGLCNSKFMNKYHTIRFQNKLYSNKYRFVSQYVSKYPVPNPKWKESKKIISIVKQIILNGYSQELESEIDLILLKLLKK